MKKENKLAKLINEHTIYMVVMSTILSSYVALEFIFVGIAYYQMEYKRTEFSIPRMYEVMEDYGSVLILLVVVISAIHILRFEKSKKIFIDDELFSKLFKEVKDSVIYINRLLGFALIYFIIVSLVKFYNIKGSLLELFSSTADTWRFCFMFCTFTIIPRTLKFKKLKKEIMVEIS